MFKPQLKHSLSSHHLILPSIKPFLHGYNEFSLPPLSRFSVKKAHANLQFGKIPCSRNIIREVSSMPSESEKFSGLKIKVILTVKETMTGVISSFGVEKPIDIKNFLNKTLLVDLVSSELDPTTGLEKDTVQSFAQKTTKVEDQVKYEAEYEIPEHFGDIGAILIENGSHREMFLQDILLDGFSCGLIKIPCASWIHSKFNNPEKRVFFTSKPYLPSQTPSGLKRLREEELKTLRGNGQGERKKFDRIYDYDVYNDLGEPDKEEELKRSVIGGKEHPYPRRCRTGRPRCKSDPFSESRGKGNYYVPRDETFSEVKKLTFSARTMYSLMHALIPSIDSALGDDQLGFPYFTAIDLMFSEGVNVPFKENGFWKTMLPRLVTVLAKGGEGLLRFEPPETINRDRFFWFKDEEFARQTLAGLNPCSIRLVTEWPLMSKLDPEIYGPPESAITTELIEREIKGYMSIEKALKHKRLFMLDYHDILLPFVEKVRHLKGTTLYGSRTLFFLSPDGILRPLAIELTRPPMNGKPQWKQVFTPSWDSTNCWLWRMAKAHVLAHDSGYHQLVSHWLRSHCVTEPYIIATNRQLSAAHPIYKLLNPHFRYTMEINALARESLINAGGIIESSFSPGMYSMELCSAIYDQEWRFDMQALPADLISRGMAIEDLTAPHGLRLTIEDYPFANDGLLLWDAIKDWVTEYVNNYYPDKNLVQEDEELQAWWTEIKTVGHEDKKDEPWWPTLKTPGDLIDILTIMIWVASAHHAAVNFGQYIFGGYFPNRPTIARTKIPTEDPTDEEWNMFLRKPEKTLLNCFPSKNQATKVMAVLDVLSNHSPDEEYIGEKMEQSWAENPVIKSAFERFNSRLKEIERIIDERNANMELRNRSGAGVVPYELLKPFSEPGVTGKGVPTSISI